MEEVRKIKLMEFGEYGEGVEITYDDESKCLEIETCYEGGFCGDSTSINVVEIPYVQEIIKERNELLKEKDELKDRCLNLYFRDEPNYQNEVLMSKIEVLEEKISDLEEELEDERNERKWYKERYYRILRAADID